jgi:methionine sulfoxide reductase catalytic subunit
MNKIDASEITPEALYRSRRQFISSMGTLLAGSALLSACRPAQSTPAATSTAPADLAPSSLLTPPAAGAAADELGGQLTDFDSIANYANYYEFTTNKTGVARLAQDFVTTPWTVEVGGGWCATRARLTWMICARSA